MKLYRHGWGLAALFTLVVAPDAQGGPGSGPNMLKSSFDGDVAAAPGADGDIRLTLDPAMQKKAEQLLASSRAPSGAIVMSDPRTGRILAWASVGSDEDLVSTPAYPAASVYKTVTAAALLEAEHVYRGTYQCYSGGESGLVESDIQFRCKTGENKIKFGQALGYSINVVFGRLAKQFLAPDDLLDMGNRLGIGDGLSIDVPFTASRVEVPSDDLGKARAAAGFHKGAVSPISVLYMMQTIANDGEAVRLQVVGEPEMIRRNGEGQMIKESTAEALTKMLEVTTRNGTSAEAFKDMPVTVAGKTGTLIVGKPARMISWFAGFAPSNNPEVVISVMLANDLAWWRKGNQVAKDALDAYFDEN